MLRYLFNRMRHRGVLFDVRELPFECQYCGSPLVGLYVVSVWDGGLRDLVPFLCPRCAGASDVDRALRALKRYARSESEYLCLAIELSARVDRVTVLQWLAR